MKKEETPIIVEVLLNHPVEKIWKAITEQNQMVHWFFDNIPDFKPEVNFYTEFNVNTGERNFLHQWKIIEVIPNKKITYDWSYKDYNGRALVTFELSKENEFIKLTLTNLIIESFSDDIPEFKRESCIGGWTYFINQRLKEYLG